jgi:hypothetical protein
MRAMYMDNFDRDIKRSYWVGVEEATCEGLVAEKCGRKNDVCDVLRCTGEPSLGLACKSISIGQCGIAGRMFEAMDPSNPGKDGYAITFVNSGSYNVTDNRELMSKYEELAPMVRSIRLKYSFPFMGDYGRSAHALVQCCSLSSECCVELRLEGFFMHYENVFVIQRAIRELKNLRNLYLEANSIVEDGCVGHLFLMLREKTPSLRYLHIPKISMIVEHDMVGTQCYKVCQFVQSCRKLVYLDVSFGKFNGKGFMSTLDVCAKNKSIQVLGLRGVLMKAFDMRTVIHRYMASGDLPLLDIVFGYEKEWMAFKNSLNLFFCLNKENRERERLLEELDSKVEICRVPYVLSELGKKQKLERGVSDTFTWFRDNGSALIELIVDLRNEETGHRNVTIEALRRTQAEHLRTV